MGGKHRRRRSWGVNRPDANRYRLACRPRPGLGRASRRRWATHPAARIAAVVMLAVAGVLVPLVEVAPEVPVPVAAVTDAPVVTCAGVPR